MARCVWSCSLQGKPRSPDAGCRGVHRGSGGGGDLVWADQLGGGSDDYGRGVAVDGSGNVYTTGYFFGTADFDPGAGTLNLTSAGSGDVFVSKLDSAGNLVWARQLGGGLDDIGQGVAVDGSGNVYTTGHFSGTADFDPGAGTLNLTSAGASDVFVVKLGDTTDPVVTPPSDVVEEATGPSGAVVSFGSGSATDNVGVTSGPTCVPPSGSLFPIGVTTVTCSASDAAGNVGSASFTVTVIRASTVGLVDPAQGLWYLRNGAGAVTSFYFGNPGDFPIVGDWDCDGDDTPGMYRQSDGFVYLRNSNTQGIADIRFFLGNPGGLPIVGDFNADGCDTVSIYRPSEGRFFIINALGQNDGGLGAAEFSYYFGNPGDKPFVGDFNGDGTETVGLHRESTGLVYFRNTHTQGVADSQFIFGDPGDRLIAGDWGIVDGVDTPAVFRPSTTTFYFRHTNTQGNADSQFTWGSTTWLPVAGAFGL
ncbi:MAG: SBBP repeat-containing protein [Acidimicrobiia bacterium]